MKGETGSTSFVTECIPTGSESGSSSWPWFNTWEAGSEGATEEKSEEGRVVVVISHSPVLFWGEWRMMEERLCSFHETFISYRFVYINRKFLPGWVSIASNTRNASLPTSDHTQPHSMRALIRAPRSSRRALHRFIANSRSLAARCVSQACSSDWAAASFVDDDNDTENRPTKKWVRLRIQGGV